ncbi:MAG: hypothetical protein ACLGID_12970 [Gammaproteobacteria bacterium]
MAAKAARTTPTRHAEERAALERELSDIEESLPALQAELEARRRPGKHAHGQALPSSGHHEAMTALSAAQARTNTIRADIAKLDRAAALTAEADQAPGKLKAIIQEIDQTATQVEELEARLTQITARISALDSELLSSQTVTAAAEQAAAQAVASAKDPKAEKAASDQMGKTIELSVAAEATVRLKRLAIETLGNEALNVEQQAETAREHIKQLESQAGETAWAKLAEHWNQKLDELESIGVLLAAADRLSGGSLLLLSDLKAPYLGARKGAELRRWDILDKADETSISIRELASA